MLNATDLVNKMKLHFPRWMDIRKRVTKSDGGKLLVSVAEETALIQDAITEFKKDFFLDGYAGREDQIVAFVYKAPVGTVDVTTVTMVEPSLPFADDIATFYASTGYAYYEDGYLFFRTEDMDESNLTIKYALSGYAMTAKAEKYHVWNVFDEFATFVGIERHEWETNQQLEQRILNVFKRRTNSTEAGLRNAILNELMILDPSLTEDEIVIERPTPTNLVKYYKEFGSVIEKLAYVNRDAYRTKRWDLDTWNYTFKSIDYVPHAWDAALDVYQNGVGFEDDLSVSLTGPNDTTNARITFYEESEEKIQEYVRKKGVKSNVKLTLTKYSNTLTPVTAKYKITASEVQDITNAPIYIDCYEKYEGTESRYIQDLATTDMKDVEIVANNTLEASKRYRLEFRPKSDYGTMVINKCNLVESGTSTSLLHAATGFAFNSDGGVYSLNSVLFAQRRHEYTSYSNVINATTGITMDDIGADAKLTLDLDGAGNERIVMKYSCDMTDTDKKYIMPNNFSLDANGYYVSNAVDEERILTIDLYANKVSFAIASGAYAYTIAVNGVEGSPVMGVGPKTVVTDSYDMPQHFTIKIMPTGSQVTVSSIKNSNYEFIASLASGAITTIGDQMYLPGVSANRLYITMRTHTGYAPVLEYVYIGSSLANVVYTTAPIEASALARSLEIDTNCKISLVELSSTDYELNRTDNYEPYTSYRGLTDNARILLDTSGYSYVESLQAPVGRFESIGTGSSLSYYLRLRKDEEARTISITGERLIGQKQFSLNELLGAVPGNGDKVYVSHLVEGFVVDVNGTQTLKTITPATLGAGSDSYKVSGVTDNVEVAFKVNALDDSKVVAKSYVGTFNSLVMFPKNSTLHIAYNQTKLITPELDSVEIVDVFSPFLPANTLMAYLVESMDATGSTQVRFHKAGIGFLGLNSWSVGRGTLRIISNVNLASSESYDLSSMAIEQEFDLTEAIALQRSYTLSTGEIIELPKYVITAPDGMEIVYRTKGALDDITTAPEFYCSETIVRESDGFNKLKYSNIHQISYIGTTPPATNTPLTNDAYSLMAPEGILIWNDDLVPAGRVVYVVYTIKIPDYIQVSSAALYKMIEYSADAYKQTGYLDYYNLASGDIVDIRTSPLYLNSVKMSIFCDTAGFEAKLVDGILTFVKTSANNVVALKTGYYYSDGQEYFLFANESADEISKFDNVEFYNVSVNEGEMTFNKRTRNYIRNSQMTLGPVTDVYSKDFTAEESVQGISRMNAITACSSFNYWKSFGADLALVTALNGLGMKITPTITNGYAYIEITDYLLNDTVVSFYMTGTAEAYIGKEKKYSGMSFTQSASIEPIISIQSSLIEENMMECRFTPDLDYKHYLIFKGACIVDDIVLADGTLHSKTKGLHDKNVKVLNLEIEEKILNDYVSRMLIGDASSSISDGAEVAADGTIVNSSKIDWGITKVKAYNEPSTWTRCIFSKVNQSNGICSTRTGVAGTIETDALYIGDKRTVNTFIYEINDVLFDNMKGFTVRVKGSNSLTGDYRTIATLKDNVGSVKGSLLMPYIKLVIEMPGGKIISDISLYIEYRSTADAAPAEVPVSSGKLLSEILDTHYTAKYKLKGIGIDSISNISDVAIQIRGAKENYAGEVWTSWKDIELDSSLGVANTITFDGYRFFQIRVSLKSRNAFVKLKYVDLGVM